MTFTPGEGLEIDWRGHVGKIKFITDEYLSLCIYRQDGSTSDTCLVVYKHQWEEIKLLKGPHRQ